MGDLEDWEQQRQPLARQHIGMSRSQIPPRSDQRTGIPFTALPQNTERGAMDMSNSAVQQQQVSIKAFGTSAVSSPTLEDTMLRTKHKEADASSRGCVPRMRGKISHSGTFSLADQERMHRDYQQRRIHQASDEEAEESGESDRDEKHQGWRPRRVHKPQHRPYHNTSHPQQSTTQSPPGLLTPARQQQQQQHERYQSNSTQAYTKQQDARRRVDLSVGSVNRPQSRYRVVHSQVNPGDPSQDDDDDEDDEEFHANVRTARRESIAATFAPTSSVGPPIITQFVRSRPHSAHIQATTTTHVPVAATTATMPNKERFPMSQVELEQRMQALRTSVSEWHNSSQRSIVPGAKPVAITRERREPAAIHMSNGYRARASLEIEDEKRTRASNTLGFPAGRHEMHEVSISSSRGSSDPPVHRHDAIKATTCIKAAQPRNQHSNGEGSFTSTSSRASASSRGDSAPQTNLQDIRQEVQSMRKELDRSKFESQQLRQWIVERSSMNGQHREDREPGLQMHQPPWDNRDKGARRGQRSQSRGRGRTSRSVEEAQESSESEEPYHSDALRWPNRQAIHNSKGGSDSQSATETNTSAESEYRGPDKRIPSTLPCHVADLWTSGDGATSQGKGRKRPLCTRILMRIGWLCFWLMVSVIMQLAVMGLLFRPQTTQNDLVTANHRNAPKTINYLSRDYVADQLGFYTFLDDGFGMDTLAYCHDLWEFPNDPRSQQQRRVPVAMNRALDLIVQTSAFVEDTLVKLSRPIRGAWDWIWATARDEGDPLDWLRK